MEIIIRNAIKEDCLRMLELIQELAVYEKEPDAVTVSFDHFVESGFGENPVWFAFVAEVDGNKGIGKLLFDKLIEECKAKKYSGMAWQVLDWNEPAINFYKKYDGVSIDKGWLNCMINF
ncbi:MAG: GNAT family N-acetyltransferase [Chitinophagaceae bacterium]|nr:GNAT family N-acetyltransferase [Chitinophagaceae bacterium]